MQVDSTSNVNKYEFDFIPPLIVSDLMSREKLFGYKTIPNSVPLTGFEVLPR